MSQGRLAWLTYPWRGGRERLLRIGDGSTAILILAPFFEEANRTRHLLVETMRGLAASGYSCFLPDFPGSLESAVPLEVIEWSDWEAAVAEVADIADQPMHVASFRGGALLDDAIESSSRWRLAPADGQTLFRDLVRTRMAADREDGRASTAAEIEGAALSAPFDVAGYRFNPSFLGAMKQKPLANHGAMRTVRLETDRAPADLHLPGQPLWRRSEPGHDPVLSQRLAGDIAHWIASCASG